MAVSTIPALNYMYTALYLCEILTHFCLSLLIIAGHCIESVCFYGLSFCEVHFSYSYLDTVPFVEV